MLASQNEEQPVRSPGLHCATLLLEIKEKDVSLVKDISILKHDVAELG